MHDMKCTSMPDMNAETDKETDMKQLDDTPTNIHII